LAVLHDQRAPEQLGVFAYVVVYAARRGRSQSRAMAVPAMLGHGRDARGTQSSRAMKDLGVGSNGRHSRNQIRLVGAPLVGAHHKGTHEGCPYETCKRFAEKARNYDLFYRYLAVQQMDSPEPSQRVRDDLKRPEIEIRKFENRNSKIEIRKSKSENRKSKIENRSEFRISIFAFRWPRTTDRGPTPQVQAEQTET
jgi:hypothetical protein